MRKMRCLFYCWFILVNISCAGENRVKFVSTDNQIDVFMDGRITATWLYRPELAKPILYPVYAPGGEVVTRWYPLKEVAGESNDHPHHTGLFFTIEGVNSDNFWAARSAPPQIVQKQITADDATASLSMVLDWTGKSGKVLLQEDRTMIFTPGDGEYSIDFTMSLTAKDTAVVFTDTKEGMFAIRVAPWLKGKGGTGKYTNADGEETEKNVWGRRSKWMQLQGVHEDKAIGIVIFNHPSSTNYPTYWHARDYGLFSANPIGQGVFQKSRNVASPEPLNLILQQGESALFKFRVLIYEGARSKMDIEKVSVAYGSE